MIFRKPKPVFDYYLRCADEQTMAAALANNNIGPGVQGMVVDSIGIIEEPTGEFSEDGEEITQAIDGWHVNLRTRKPLGQNTLPIIPEPKNPVRKFAGRNNV